MGRPSEYRPEFAEQARKLCEFGATDRELADFFEVDERTINRWKIEFPEFCQSLKVGKSAADDRVEQSLYRRALGYSHDAVKIFADPKTGAEQLVPFIEHYPPDTTACIFWLKNRRKDEWRDKTEAQHTGPNGGPIETVVRYVAEFGEADANPSDRAEGEALHPATAAEGSTQPA